MQCAGRVERWQLDTSPLGGVSYDTRAGKGLPAEFILDGVWTISGAHPDSSDTATEASSTYTVRTELKDAVESRQYGTWENQRLQVRVSVGVYGVLEGEEGNMTVGIRKMLIPRL